MIISLPKAIKIFSQSNIRSNTFLKYKMFLLLLADLNYEEEKDGT